MRTATPGCVVVGKWHGRGRPLRARAVQPVERWLLELWRTHTVSSTAGYFEPTQVSHVFSHVRNRTDCALLTRYDKGAAVGVIP
jgi:hypothetical protein